MAIYTHFGSEVTLCDARLITVWVEKNPHEVKWHYTEPKKIRRSSAINEVPIWHYRGWYTDSGRPICDGKWVSANGLRADGGYKEIDAKLLELCPDGPEKYNQWNRTGSPRSSEFFPPIDAKMVA